MASSDEGSSSKQLADSVVIDSSPSDVDHHGIPKAIFFDDIPKVVETHSAPALIDKLSSLSQKYRFFEERLVKGKNTLEEKIAEVKRAIAAVSALKKRATSTQEPSSTSTKNGTKTHFELSDGIYVEATIPQTETVCLWLGANVMVEYTHKEALQLLDNNLTSAQSSFTQTSDDIIFLRDQLNSTDVNLSRVYNHHVKSVRTPPTNPAIAAVQPSNASAPMQS